MFQPLSRALTVLAIATAAAAAGARGQQAPAAFAWTPERPLAWNDFIGRPEASSQGAAMTAYEMRTRTTCQAGRLAIDVDVIFLPDRSWVKPGQTLERTLRHEQGHFDLGEVSARRFRAELGKLTIGCDAPPDVLLARVQEFRKRDADQQRSYDRQTAFGTDTAAQHVWDSRIKTWLRQALH